MVKTEEALLLFLFLFLPIISVSSIPLGSTLYATDPTQKWSSPNNTFSLTFLPIQPPTSPPSFILAIVYSGGGNLVIWTAGGGSSVDSGGSFRFHSTGTLQLVNGSDAIIWDSETSNLGVSSAFLDDQGNLVLKNSTDFVWSSFNHPTDTLVPSKNFTTDMALKSGEYSFELQSSGNLVLRWNESVVYWNQSINLSINQTLTSPVLILSPVGILSVHDPNLTDSPVVAYSNDYAELGVMRILKLDSDGNLRIYSSSDRSGSANIRWTALEDQCKVFGYCGSYGICSYKDSDPVCGCASQNFEMIDLNNSRKGCRRKVKLEDCPEKVGLLKMDHTLLLTYNISEMFFVGISACNGNCLAGDFCFAATSVSDGTGRCYIKSTDFFSGYQSPSIPSTSYVKVCLPLAPNPPSATENVNDWDWSMHPWIALLGSTKGASDLDVTFTLKP